MSERKENLESRWTRVNGLLLHSRVSSHSTGAPLSPLILVHGLGVSSRYMIPLAKQLALDHPVYAPDLPGFGRSDKPARALNLMQLSEALAAWMSANELARATLIANSIGCQIIVDLALRHPELAHQLVLISPTVDVQTRSALRQFFLLLRDIPREPPALLFIALLDYLQAGLGRSAKTFAYALQDEVERKLPHVRQPALIVRGGRDPLVSQFWVEEMERLLPESRLKVIRRAAHAVNYNSPEKLARVVLEFLNSIS